MSTPASMLVLALAMAPGSEASAEGSVSASTDGAGRTSASADGLRIWAPERNMFELGLWVGALIPSRRHEFYDPRVVGQSPYDPAAVDLGLRFAYFPLRFLGAEIEGGVMPTSVDGGSSALLYTVRGHVIGQLPWWRLTPFLVVGGGGMGVSSGGGAQGDDIDRSFHWGPGLKFFVNRWLALRLDLRHLVGARVGVRDGAASHFEVLLGASVTFGRKKKEQASDDDQGCVEVDGECRDSDGDGIHDGIDECPDDPEADNGYEDDDGCPDEVPQRLRGATGVLPGITFETGSANIKPESRETLDEAAETMKANPEHNLSIEGHTDNVGDREMNLELSRKRANSVRDYMIGRGVDGERISAAGYGPDRPIADNDTDEGRAQNRRIEFKLRKKRGAKPERKRRRKRRR